MAISKQTALPPVTIGFALLIAASLLWLGGELSRAETRVDQNTVEIADVADRQGKYIGTNGSLTREIQTLRSEIQGLRERVVVLETTECR